MKRSKIVKMVSAMVVCLSINSYAKVNLVEHQYKTLSPELILEVDSINDGLTDVKFNIESSRWEGTSCKYELMQNLPIQIITEDRVVHTIRLKDIVSYKFKPGNNKIVVTLKGSEYRNYGYIDRVIDDPESIKLIISLFEVQRELILAQFK